MIIRIDFGLELQGCRVRRCHRSRLAQRLSPDFRRGRSHNLHRTIKGQSSRIHLTHLRPEDSISPGDPELGMQSTVALIATAHTLILHVLAFGGMSMLQSDRLPPRRLGNRGWLACSSLLFCRHGYSRRLPARYCYNRGSCHCVRDIVDFGARSRYVMLLQSRDKRSAVSTRIDKTYDSLPSFRDYIPQG